LFVVTLLLFVLFIIAFAIPCHWCWYRLRRRCCCCCLPPNV
jgi:hypothetical protein